MAEIFSKENIQDASVGIVCIVLKTAGDLVKDAISDFKEIQDLFAGSDPWFHRLGEWIASHGIPSDVLVIALTIWVATAAKRGIRQGFLPALSILAIFLGWVALAVCARLAEPPPQPTWAPGSPRYTEYIPPNLLLSAGVPCVIAAVVLGFTIVVVKPAQAARASKRGWSTSDEF